MVEGESGLLAISGDSDRPNYEPSKRRLTWPNGALATLYSADEPDRLRGPQHDGAWCDELAAWRYLQEAWDMLMMGLRLGANPRCVVTTTPRPRAMLKALALDPHTHLTRGSTFDNLPNLAPQFADQIIGRYKNTRLGRQELEGELLEDVEGALWHRALIEDARAEHAPDLRRVVVGVDPAVTSGEESDETGIVVAGQLGDEWFVLADWSGIMSPDAWARRAVNAYHEFAADRIIGEVNNGGDLVETVIRTVDPNVSYEAVRASRGKAKRAEPVAALYEQGRVHHVGEFRELEDQMCSFVPQDAGAQSSPDRMDALVWAVTALNNTHEPQMWL
jgi:phage terminase large subunit-like protein